MMNGKTILICASLALAAAVPARAGSPLKTRKQLENENKELREKLEMLQDELESFRKDVHERDSLRKALLEMSRDDESREAAGMGATDYFDAPGGGDDADPLRAASANTVVKTASFDTEAPSRFTPAETVSGAPGKRVMLPAVLDENVTAWVKAEPMSADEAAEAAE